jgi:endonuclease/exonuclease/phosphatase family metal-dependent hydrolase
MTPHARPSPAFTYRWSDEIAALRHYRASEPGRRIPDRKPGYLLAATWNLTNFGLQKRREEDIRLMAEMVGWFDIVAVQEIAVELGDIDRLLGFLPGRRILLSDPGGNDERLGFIYDPERVSLREMVAEVAVPPADHRYIRIKGVSGSFAGFDRNPYVGTFTVDGFDLSMVSVHLYYGAENWRSVDRRRLEAYAVGRWAHLRRKSGSRYAQNILVLGDFNLPKRERGDPIYDALTKRGLRVPKHSTRIGSNLTGDMAYDQVAFFPGDMDDRYVASGVFDFDGAIFRDAWQNRKDEFTDIVKYYIADHRPMWVRIRTS